MHKVFKMELELDLGNKSGKNLYHNVIVAGRIRTHGELDEITISTHIDDADCEKENYDEELLCLRVEEIDDVIEAMLQAKEFVLKEKKKR